MNPDSYFREEAWAKILRDDKQRRTDCAEDKHTWERLSDGSRCCVWCDAKVRRVGT